MQALSGRTRNQYGFPPKALPAGSSAAICDRSKAQYNFQRPIESDKAALTPLVFDPPATSTATVGKHFLQARLLVAGDELANRLMILSMLELKEFLPTVGVDYREVGDYCTHGEHDQVLIDQHPDAGLHQGDESVSLPRAREWRAANSGRRRAIALRTKTTHISRRDRRPVDETAPSDKTDGRLEARARP